VFNLALECVIVHKLRLDFKEKKSRLATQISEMAATSPGGSEAIQRMRHKKKTIEKNEARAIAMVLVNGFVNFLLKIPDTFTLSYFIIVYFFQQFPSGIFCTNTIFCYTLVDIAGISFILSCSTNFFIFYYILTPNSDKLCCSLCVYRLQAEMVRL
jgi:hypothetical protein